MSRTILVVEDNPVMAGLLELVLRQMKLKSVITDSLADATELLERSPLPDGLVIDLDLPAATGWRLLRQLMGKPGLSRIPRIVLSSRAVPDSEIPLVSNGTSAHVDKHEFDLKEFEDIIRRLFTSGRDA